MKKAKRDESPDWGTEMDSNILIFIFQKLPVSDLLLGAAQVCSEWRKAASNTRFFVAPGNRLSLQLLDTLTCSREKAIYINLLKAALLNSADHTLLHLQFPPHAILPQEVVLYIAQRSTSLKSVYLPDASLMEFFPSLLPKILPYWKNLTSFTAETWSASTLDCITILGLHCNNLTHLGLYGFIEAHEAEAIVASFPQLQSLDFRSCFFSKSALEILLNGAKNLKNVDLTHAICGDDHVDMKNFARKVIREGGAMELKEEIGDKLKALQIFTYCGGKTCWNCYWFY